MNRDLHDMRQSYELNDLHEGDLAKDPIAQFTAWFDAAKAAGVHEPNAMILSTATRSGIPNSRVVLLKEIEADALVFYTNYESEKGREIAENPAVSLCFLWKEMERQVRVLGVAEKVSREQSNRYFASRPYGSRIGAHVSAQSSIIQSRAELEKRKAELEAQYPEDQPFDAPEHWGGYRVYVAEIEFWQGRPSRLHDRLRYRQGEDQWIIERLAP